MAVSTIVSDRSYLAKARPMSNARTRILRALLTSMAMLNDLPQFRHIGQCALGRSG